MVTTIQKKPIQKPIQKLKPKPNPKSAPPSKKPKKEEENNSSSVDEKGNPLPMENKEEGGDPICPGGYKIDSQFDPINDPINPLFRCIPALKDPNDGVAGKLLAMANNTSGGVENLATSGIPGTGMGGGKKPKRGTKRRSRRTRRTRRRS
jgi:hypothetical protein